MKAHTPPPAVRAAARRGLELRAAQSPSNRGGTEVGLARARDLANGRPVSESVLRRMVSFFARHEVDKAGRGWGANSKGYQAWLLWGGDPGRAWAERLLRKANGGPRRYYLIELDPAAVRTKKASRQNTRAGGPVVYVGSTVHDPQCRWGIHRGKPCTCSIGRSDERTASHIVRRFGRRYLGEILEPTGEREIAAFLRRQGYTVVQS